MPEAQAQGHDPATQLPPAFRPPVRAEGPHKPQQKEYPKQNTQTLCHPDQSEA